MNSNLVRSYAKINAALNVLEKKTLLHKIESIIFFVSLYDSISIKRIKSIKHQVQFSGKFSKNIKKDNTVSKLLRILDERKLIKNKKFQIKIIKRIPNKAGLGGGSMNAANVLKYFIKKKIIKISKKEIYKICKLIGSDVIIGLNSTNSILNSKNKIRSFKNCKIIHTLIVKPNFGCSTKYIYSKVKKFTKAKFNKPNKKMFNLDYLKTTSNQLEKIAFLKYPKLKSIKQYLENSLNPELVRMTGSGSAIVAYFQSKERCENAKKEFNKRYKNYWSMTSKTI